MTDTRSPDKRDKRIVALAAAVSAAQDRKVPQVLLGLEGEYAQEWWIRGACLNLLTVTSVSDMLNADSALYHLRSTALCICLQFIYGISDVSSFKTIICEGRINLRMVMGSTHAGTDRFPLTIIQVTVVFDISQIFLSRHQIPIK